MIAALWRTVRRLVTPASRETPFVRQMRDVRCEAIAKTRQSIRAQREDRARREHTNFMADDLLGGGQSPPERGSR